jgi:hypothetical protein
MPLQVSPSLFGRRSGKRLLKVGLSAAISAFALVAVLAQSVFADPRDFTFENDSFSYIHHLYVAPSSSSSWGDDILGIDVLGPGESVDLSFDAAIARTCIYDLLVVTEDGTRTRKNRVNLCTTTIQYYTEN